MRPVFLETGVVSAATGSALVEIGRTKVVCSVHGPHALQSFRDPSTSLLEEGRLKCEVRFAPFAKRADDTDIGNGGGHGPTDLERDMSSLVRHAVESSVRLEMLTKSVLDLHVVVLAAGGGELAAAITCASLALANSGVELLGLVAGVTVGGVGESLLVDPTTVELEEGPDSFSMTAAVFSGGGTREVTQWWMQGRAAGPQFMSAVNVALDGCASLHDLMRSRLIKDATFEAAT
jgi:exosome complex component MTR3